MTAVIIPFALRHSETNDNTEYTVDLMHLDLTSQCLSDHGWSANIIMYNACGAEKAPTLRTNAPLPDAINASKKAYAILCEFIISECNLEQSDLPNQEYFSLRIVTTWKHQN